MSMENLHKPTTSELEMALINSENENADLRVRLDMVIEAGPFPFTDAAVNAEKRIRKIMQATENLRDALLIAKETETAEDWEMATARLNDVLELAND